MKGRKIDTTIHTIKDLIQLAENKDIGAAAIFLDQEKAFDRVDHDFLYDTMKRFNIGNSFINWVKMIYKNANIRIQINGMLTDKVQNISKINTKNNRTMGR